VQFLGLALTFEIVKMGPAECIPQLLTRKVLETISSFMSNDSLLVKFVETLMSAVHSKLASNSLVLEQFFKDVIAHPSPNVLPLVTSSLFWSRSLHSASEELLHELAFLCADGFLQVNMDE